MDHADTLWVYAYPTRHVEVELPTGLNLDIPWEMARLVAETITDAMDHADRTGGLGLASARVL